MQALLKTKEIIEKNINKGMKIVFISRERLSLLITKRSSDNTTTQMVMITVDSHFHKCVTFFFTVENEVN